MEPRSCIPGLCLAVPFVKLLMFSSTTQHSMVVKGAKGNEKPSTKLITQAKFSSHRNVRFWIFFCSSPSSNTSLPSTGNTHFPTQPLCCHLLEEILSWLLTAMLWKVHVTQGLTHHWAMVSPYSYLFSKQVVNVRSTCLRAHPNLTATQPAGDIKLCVF